MSNLAEQLIERTKDKRRTILVCGDTIIDSWINGCVTECQDGCPRFVRESNIETPGGAALAASCLRNWNVKVVLYGYADNDCPVKYRYVDNNKIVFRVDDDGPTNRGSGYDWSRSLALEMVIHADGVLLSDYDKGFLLPEFIKDVSGISAIRGICCVADVKRHPELYAGCIIKGNEYWFKRWYGHSPMFGIDKNQVCTRGEFDPLLYDGCAESKLPPVKCVNHVGAGDCFAAHLTLALAYGFSIKDAAAIAHSAGRVYVQFPHSRPPHPKEVAADLESAVVSSTLGLISTSTP